MSETGLDNSSEVNTFITLYIIMISNSQLSQETSKIDEKLQKDKTIVVRICHIYNFIHNNDLQFSIITGNF